MTRFEEMEKKRRERSVVASFLVPEVEEPPKVEEKPVEAIAEPEKKPVETVEEPEKKPEPIETPAEKKAPAAEKTSNKKKQQSVPSVTGRGRPKEEGRELKQRVTLSITPSLYEDLKKIAYVQRRSVSDLISSIVEEFRDEHTSELNEYKRITRR